MIHQLESQILILLTVACVVGIGARRVRLPYTLALVVAGLVLSFVDLPALSKIDLSADLLLLLLLPALLFEAAFHIEWRDFKSELGTVLMLAVPGVAIGVTATGALLYLVLGATGLVEGFGWVHALVVGAVIAATDPISVLALFKELGVTKRLYLLVEGESLLNDGVAVVAFFIILAVFGISFGGNAPPVLDGTADIVAHSLVTFVRMAVGGALLGAIIGLSVSALTRHLDDHLLETTLTTLVAYGSFFVAEELHTSGVLCTVLAGLVMGSVGARHGMSPVTKRAVEDFWEYMAFLANSFIFLLVGLDLEPWRLVSNTGAIIAAFAAMVCVRAAIIYVLVPLANRGAHRPVPFSWRHVMVWGGLRGSLSMVLVVALPNDFPGKETLVSLVFGVVALSLFVQGLTIKPLLRKLGLLRHATSKGDYEDARARILTARGALDRLHALRREGVLDHAPHQRLEALYSSWLEKSEAAAESSAGTTEYDEQLAEGLRHLCEEERRVLRTSVNAGVLSEDAASALEADVLTRLQALEEAEEQGEQAVAAFVESLRS